MNSGDEVAKSDSDHFSYYTLRLACNLFYALQLLRARLTCMNDSLTFRLNNLEQHVSNWTDALNAGCSSLFSILSCWP